MKRFTWRALLYAVVLGYLVLDLKVCHGPVREAMRSRRDTAVAAAREHGWVALVNLEPVTREQVDLAVARHLHQRGRKAADLPEKSLAVIRRAALQALIDDLLVRQYADGEGFQAPVEEQAAFAASWRAGFPSSDELANRASDLGLAPSALAALDTDLGRVWSRKRWLERRLQPGVEVTEAEAREWFEENRLGEDGRPRPGFVEPDRVRVRHLRFGRDAEDAARAALARLAAGTSPEEPGPDDSAPFEEEVWVDPTTLPAPLGELVGSAPLGQWSGPTASALGWHLVAVLERRESRALDYEELKPEIFALLEAERREEAFGDLMQKQRKVANWQVFPENL